MKKINYEERLNISLLIGKTLIKIHVIDDEKILFTTLDNDFYMLYHGNMELIGGCCVEIYLEDICGDLKDLLNYPILTAEEVTEDRSPYDNYGTATWTFYKLSTIKGNVTIRFYGSSNGYYSESVHFTRNNEFLHNEEIKEIKYKYKEKIYE